MVYPSDNFDGGVYNYRQYLPYTTMARFFGCKLKMNSQLDSQDIEMADIVVFNRQYNEGCLKAMEYSLLKKKLVVFDLDDNIFAVQKENPAYETYTDKTVMHNLKLFIEHANVFIVSNVRLAEALKHYRKGKPTTIIENGIPWGFFQKKINKNSTPTVSWHGGPSHLGDLNLVKKLPMIMDKWRFVSFGSVNIEGWEHVPVVPFKAFYQVLRTIDPDVAVTPLNINAFNQCRTCIKFVENTAVGAANVCTKYGPYAELEDYVIFPKDNNNPEAWAEAIEEAFEKRNELVSKADLLVRERFNTRKVAFDLGKVLIDGYRGL